ncbi:MAG TPA: hypothetical protein VFD03_06150 [Clostridia bacterium]|nr:hypothetical protein [Clostridia bacterium]
MKCKECCNNINGTCRTMREKPKDSWCYVTPKQAIEAEKEIIYYIVKLQKASEYFRQIKIAKENIVRLKLI